MWKGNKVVLREDKSMTCKVIDEAGEFTRIELEPGDWKIVNGKRYDYMEILKNWNQPQHFIKQPRFTIHSKNMEQAQRYNVAYKFLKNTDFIIEKFTEEVLMRQSESRESFLEKYKDILDDRKLAREILSGIQIQDYKAQ